MKKLSIAFALAASMLTLSAQAGPTDNLYGEVGVGTYSEKFQGFTLSQNVVRGIVGSQVNNVFAVESHIATGIGNTDVSGRGANFAVPNTGINYSLGLFAKASAPLSETVAVFGRVGVTHTSMKILGDSDSSSQGAYGVGAEFALDKKTAFTIDYTRYTSGFLDEKSSTVLAGLNFKF